MTENRSSGQLYKPIISQIGNSVNPGLYYASSTGDDQKKNLSNPIMGIQNRPIGNVAQQSLASLERREPIQIVNKFISGSDTGKASTQFQPQHTNIGGSKLNIGDPVKISSHGIKAGNASVYIPTTNIPGVNASTYIPITNTTQANGKMAQSTFQPITATSQQNYNQFGLFTPLTKQFNHEAYQSMYHSNKPTDPQEYQGDLERKLGDQRVEGTNLRKNMIDLESRHSDLGTQYNMLSTEFSNLRREYDALMQVKSEQHATQAQLERTTQEKDFHYEQHVSLRRDLLNQLNKDFENDQLRRENVYAQDELRAFKEKTLVLEKQIEEQLVFTNKPKSDEEGGREFYFAKIIVNLEDRIQVLTKERDQLAYDNKNQKEGIREVGADVQNQTKLNETYEERNPQAKGTNLNNTLLEGGTDGMIEQLRKMKRKNDMLKKENVLIRKELENSLNTRKAPGHNIDGVNTDMMRYELEDLRQENKDLKQRVQTLMIDSNKGRSSMGGGDNLRESKKNQIFTSSEDADRQTLQLEEQKVQVLKLRQENGMLRVQGYHGDGSNVDNRLQDVLRDYLEQIEVLTAENEEHRMKGLEGHKNLKASAGNNDDKLRNENKALKEERDLLKKKVTDLQKKLEIKEAEIREMKYFFVIKKIGWAGMLDTKVAITTMQFRIRWRPMIN